MVRGDSLHADMSAYLVWRIEQTPNIEVLLNTEVQRMLGDSRHRGILLPSNGPEGTTMERTPACGR